MEIKCVKGHNPCHTNQHNIEEGAYRNRHECPVAGNSIQIFIAIVDVAPPI